jgi:hypothetical protein
MAIFSLQEVKELQIQNVNDNNFESWPEGATYGYYGGGGLPGIINTISRLDFFNESVSDPGNNLPTARGFLSAVSTSFYGYFGGGSVPSSISTISRLDYSNETLSDLGNNLPASVQNLAAMSSNSYGYFGGGTLPPFVNTISRIDFSNETVSNPGNNLPTARGSLAATSSNSYGYFGGGSVPSSINTISRLDFSNETVSDPGKNLPTAKSFLEATSSNSYGYFGGGESGASSFSAISRLDFSNETLSDPGNNLPTARGSLAATSSSFYGYFGGGLSAIGPLINYSSLISRLDFFNETVSNPGKNLPTARSNMASVSGGASVYREKGFKTYGYYAGGSPALTTVSRLDFSNETLSDPGKNLPAGRYLTAKVTSNNYNYFAGSEPSGTNVITRFDFSNETLNDPGKNLLISYYQVGSVNSNNYGYFYGGYKSGGTPTFPAFAAYTTVTRLDFSNETLNNPGKNLIYPSIVGNSSVSTKSYGYIVRATNVYPPSEQLKINYSNEVVSLTFPWSPTGISYATTVQNNLYGYFCGGTVSPSFFPFAPSAVNTIRRLDFSNETLNNPGKNMPTTFASLSGSSSSFYGYVNMGPSQSQIVRIEFSTEDVSLTGTGFSPSRIGNTGFSNSN